MHEFVYVHTFLCKGFSLCLLLHNCNLVFQSDGDSDLTEDSHLEREPENPTKVVSGSSTSDPCAPSESGCERGADSRENLQETRQNNVEENVRRTGTSLGRGSETAAATVAPAASKAHLFIFDRESQDVESQSVLSERAAAPARLQEAASAGSAHSLSQIQLEEDKQRITKLMEETKQVSKWAVLRMALGRFLSFWFSFLFFFVFLPLWFTIADQ